MDENSRNRKLH